MNKKLIALIIVMFIMLLTALTCPDKQTHQEEICTTVSNVIDRKASEIEGGNILIKETFSLLGAKTIADILSTKLKVHNYIFFSTGEIYFDGKPQTISFGILNQVFTISEKSISEYIDKYFKLFKDVFK